MNSRKLLQQALGFLESYEGYTEDFRIANSLASLNEAIRAHLAKEPEPVAWGIWWADNRELNEMFFKQRDAEIEADDYSNPRGVYVAPLYRLEDV